MKTLPFPAVPAFSTLASAPAVILKITDVPVASNAYTESDSVKPCRRLRRNLRITHIAVSDRVFIISIIDPRLRVVPRLMARSIL
jgi:hypothetical protein